MKISIRKKTQRGAVLLMSLLLVVFTSLIVTLLASRHYYEIRYTKQLIMKDKAYYLSLGIAEWGKEIIHQQDKITYLEFPKMQYGNFILSGNIRKLSNKEIKKLGKSITIPNPVFLVQSQVNSSKQIWRWETLITKEKQEKSS